MTACVEEPSAPKAENPVIEPDEPTEPEQDNTNYNITPYAEIPDEDVPLVNIPDEDVPLVDIPDEEVPLAAVPKTGDPMAVYAALATLSAMGLAALSFKKKEN